MVQNQFAEEVVSWAGRVQGEGERQGRELTSLKAELRVLTAELSTEVAKCKRDMGNGLMQIRALVHETQAPLQEALRRLSSQVTEMSKEWGKDIAQLLKMSQQSVESIDTRLAVLNANNIDEHDHLQAQIAETKS